MTQKYSRAQRRADYARLKKKRRNHWGYGGQGWRSYCYEGVRTMPPEVAGSVVNTPTPCSCYMCGNPRRNSWANVYEARTLQERKAFDSYKAGLDEVDDTATYRWEKYDPWWDDDWDFSDEEDPVTAWYLKGLYIKG